MTNSFPPNGLPDLGSCQSTRQILDFARPGDVVDCDGAGPALEEARRHLEKCRACQVAVHQTERVNARIGEVCRDVSVPSDLRDRILTSIAESRVVGPASSDAVPRNTAPVATAEVLPRRRWLKKLVAAAACLAVSGAGAWLATRRPLQKLSLEQWVQMAVDLSAGNLPLHSAYADGTVPQPPGTMLTRFLTEPPREVADGRGAVYFFQFPARRGGATVQGRLLVVPVRWVESPPAATGFLSRPAVYLGRQFCASMWVEGEFCYVCLVKGGGGENELHSLEMSRPVAT